MWLSFFFILRCLMMASLLLWGMIASALAETDYGSRDQRKKIKTAKVTEKTGPTLSCYANLTAMVRSSSLTFASKAHLNVERDDGEHVLVQVHRGEKSDDNTSWLVYSPATQTLKDVSDIVEDGDREAAFSGEYGEKLSIDRRFPYAFHQCRQRRNLECHELARKSHAEVANLSLLAQARVRRLDKRETGKIYLYSVAHMGCPIDEDVALKIGTALKIYHESGDFYFVRQDGFKGDFITGWILKAHVDNIKFLVAPAAASAENIEVIPTVKSVAAARQDAPPTKIKSKTKINAPPLIESDFDASPFEVSSTIIEQEIKIPVPVTVKPSPYEENQVAPVQRQRSRSERPRRMHIRGD